MSIRTDLSKKTTLNSLANENAKPRLGVSACLMGMKVRFDGGHMQDTFLQDSLAKYVDYVSVCPEVGAGFATPRPAMQLRLSGKSINLVMSKDPNQDMTEQMQTYTEAKIATLGELDGFIFKKNSPSCGVFRVPVVINDDGYRERNGRGLFAEAFMKRFPLIPVEEEGRLNDPALCENFIERVYAYRRWKKIENAERNVKALIEFHSRHKLMLMARGSHYYQELGRLVAGTTLADLAQKREAYINRFMQVMALIAPRGRQVNVLQHIMGYLKQAISSEDKQELLNVFDAYRKSQLPLITPLTLLRHHLRVHPQPYIGEQHYLAPFPEQLALRSFI